MEDFRKQAKKTIKIWTALIIAAIILRIGLGAAVWANVIPKDGVNYNFSDGFCAGLIVLMAVNISRYTAALKDDEKLKKLYITETDERSRLIYEKSNSSSFRTVIVLLGLSAMVASFISETVFFTLLAVILAIAFIQAGFSFYYRRKY
ncbi:MAG: hypothetical protein NC253_03975 [Ruminococcus sp.]|nr:hypothetical protein [Ruminococcus sp.]MCM1381150.1 hypothetical protein [Muribaculaceae bacterium]MCM1478817.1 hypothetical protein [Muribaculaceae bacterium]